MESFFASLMKKIVRRLVPPILRYGLERKKQDNYLLWKDSIKKMMEAMVDNGLRAVQRSKSLVIEKSKLACTGLASMFPTFSFATSLISRIKTYQ